MARIFVVSDTHFNHGNILNFVNSDGAKVRPEFSSVEEMNEKIIANWNSVVTSMDHVYHLGDVYFGRGKDSSNIRNILSRLHGVKRLILGNHDDGQDKILHEFFPKIMLWRMFKDEGVILSHIPLHESTIGETRWGGKAINVHGHIHRSADISDRHINASVEMTNYTPVLLTDLIARKVFA